MKQDVYAVVVIGLGAMGSAALYHLAKRGRRVLGVDQFSVPHDFGSPHGDTRIARRTMAEGERYVPLAFRSYELWQALEQESGRDLLVRTGALSIGALQGTGAQHAGIGFMDRSIEVAQKYGIAHQVLSAR
jgi:sarcosine oxidase